MNVEKRRARWLAVGVVLAIVAGMCQYHVGTDQDAVDWRFRMTVDSTLAHMKAVGSEVGRGGHPSSADTDDAWGVPLRIEEKAEEVVVSSAGQDMVWNTRDDLRVVCKR
jgi:hypothetical protein